MLVSDCLPPAGGCFPEELGEQNLPLMLMLQPLTSTNLPSHLSQSFIPDISVTLWSMYPPLVKCSSFLLFLCSLVLISCLTFC